MSFGLSLPFGLAAPRATSAPTEAQMKTVLNQSGGSDRARDTVVKQDAQARAARMVNNKMSSLRLPQKAATVGKKKGA